MSFDIILHPGTNPSLVTKKTYVLGKWLNPSFSFICMDEIVSDGGIVSTYRVTLRIKWDNIGKVLNILYDTLEFTQYCVLVPF